MITEPLNGMIFNSLHFAVIQVKTISLAKKSIYAVFWQRRLKKKVLLFWFAWKICSTSM
jgi:hypothetical protein